MSSESARSSSRMRSPSGVPPGSRVSTTTRPSRCSRSRSSSACVVLPQPSSPSNVTNMASLRYGAVRAIVTGGAGFIGSHLVDALVARGDDVLVLDDLSSGRRERVPEPARLEVVDIREAGPVAGAFAAASAEVCFHLAAQADVRVSVERPEFDAEVNVIGTVNVLQAAHWHGTRVVLASTGGAIYGECDGPAPETATRRPVAPYGASKLAGEEYLATFTRLYGAKHVSLRYANIYGPRQDPHGEAGVVAIFLGRLARGEPLRIFGDGRQTRDYAYVGDVA